MDIERIAAKLFRDNRKDGKKYILKEELKDTQYHDVFDLVDADKDGKITVKEISNALTANQWYLMVPAAQK